MTYKVYIYIYIYIYILLLLLLLEEQTGVSMQHESVFQIENRNNCNTN